MGTLIGTEQNDDIQADVIGGTVFGLGGNDILRGTIGFNAGSIPGEAVGPLYIDQLHGGAGDDTYIMAAPVSFPIYSTPIIWGSIYGVAQIYEEISETDRNDILDVTAFTSGFVYQPTFDGKTLTIYNAIIADNYGVDAQGNLLSAVDFVKFDAFSLWSLTEESASFAFIKNGTDQNDTVTGTGSANVIDGRDGNDTLYGLGGNDFMTGGVGDDAVDGGEGDDTLYGGSGFDILIGGAGKDVLFGMTGDDNLFGGSDNDTYVYNSVADGIDTITEGSGLEDVIRFGSSISASDVELIVNGNDLDIGFLSSPEALVRIVGQNTGGNARVEKLIFSDGAVIDIGAYGNVAPVASDDVFFVYGGESLQGNLLSDNGNGVDFDSDGDSLSVVAQSLVSANGSVIEINQDGEFSFIPASGFGGVDTFEYTLVDAYGAIDTALVTVNVVHNSAPVAKDDYFVINEDSVLSGNLLTDNGAGEDADLNGDSLKVQIGSFVSASGAVISILDNGDFSYTPIRNFNGVDSFQYTVSDGHGGFSAATAYINVLPVNDAPEAHNDLYAAGISGVVTGNLLSNDTDVDGDILSAQPSSLVTTNGNTVIVNADGAFEYKASNGYFSPGQESFSYTALDGHGGVDTATATIRINAPSGSINGTSAKNEIAGTASANTIFGLGGNDKISGKGGNDNLYGDDGDDKLYGDDGHDSLYGGSGNDGLLGGTGNDLLVGGLGQDSLKGELGSDVFKFTVVESGALDTVQDFKISQYDKLDLSDLLDAYDPLTDLIADFVRFTEDVGATTLHVDVTGAGSFNSSNDVAILSGVKDVLAGGVGAVSTEADLQSLIDKGILLV